MRVIKKGKVSFKEKRFECGYCGCEFLADENDRKKRPARWRLCCMSHLWQVYFLVTMATLTKKDLLEAIEDMPMDAEIEFYHYNIGYGGVYQAHYNEELNRIELC